MRTQFSLTEANLEAASLVVFPADRLSSSHASRGRRDPGDQSKLQRRNILGRGHTARQQGTEYANPDHNTLLDAL